MKLALGTVQFGLEYGISGNGQVRQAEVKTIVEQARLAGIDTLDTAILYGESERLLGETGISEFNVITKLPSIPVQTTEVSDWVVSQIQESMLRLKVNKLQGVLLHAPKQLLEPCGDSIWEELDHLKTSGLVHQIGYSIYDQTELDQLFTRYRPDIVQVPYNLFDRGVERSGWLQRLYEEGVETHVRSIFLQGLLLMSSERRPEQFKKWAPLFSAWDTWLEEGSSSAIETCLSFALQEKRIHRVIVGVDSPQQFDEIITASKRKIDQFPSEVECCDEELIHPSRWQTT